MSDYVTIKIPRWAADLAFQLQAELARRGTESLPAEVRDDLLNRGHNGPTLGKGVTVGAALLVLRRELVR